MKNLTLLIFGLLFTQITAISQPCLPEGIFFSTQEQIDNFQNNYPNCTEIEGDVTIGGLMLVGCDITNLEGLDVLTSIGGSLSIYRAPISDFAGLENLSSIGGNLTIGGYFAGNSLTSLNGIDNLTFLGGGLDINANPLLTDINAFHNITFIGGYLLIGYNESLMNFTGLDNLITIGGDLNIIENKAITEIVGLENLTTIGGIFEIRNNENLSNLTGLENINPASIQQLSIYNNTSLNSCDAESICNYLASPNGTIEIYDNASGCNSPEEVDSICNIVEVQELNVGNEFSISPNPNSGSLHLRFAIYELGVMTIDLFDISGFRIKQLVNENKIPGIYEMEIDLNDIPVGIYFCTLKTNKGIQTKKIIKLN